MYQLKILSCPQPGDERRQRDVNKRHFLFRLKKQGIPCFFQRPRTVLCSPTWDVKQSKFTQVQCLGQGPCFLDPGVKRMVIHGILGPYPWLCMYDWVRYHKYCNLPGVFYHLIHCIKGKTVKIYMIKRTSQHNFRVRQHSSSCSTPVDVTAGSCSIVWNKNYTTKKLANVSLFEQLPA